MTLQWMKLHMWSYTGFDKRWKKCECGNKHISVIYGSSIKVDTSKYLFPILQIMVLYSFSFVLEWKTYALKFAAVWYEERH